MAACRRYATSSIVPTARLFSFVFFYQPLTPMEFPNFLASPAREYRFVAKRILIICAL